MPYVKRDSLNAISAVSDQALEGFTLVADEDAELQQYLASLSTRNALSQSDLGFVRVVEDVIELLIEKNIILFTELPQHSQQKMLDRQRLRDTLRGGSLDLIGDEDGF